MIVWIVENGEPIKYERTGACNACGACCRGYNIQFQWKTAGCGEEQQPEDYNEVEGWSALKAHGVWWWFKITGIEKEEGGCEMQKDGYCTIWKDDVEFPPLCRYFPVHPDNLKLFDKCGFAFERR